MAEKLQEYSLTWEVTDEMTAKRIGSAGSQILSTPNMVALMDFCISLFQFFAYLHTLHTKAFCSQKLITEKAFQNKSCSEAKISSRYMKEQTRHNEPEKTHDQGKTGSCKPWLFRKKFSQSLLQSAYHISHQAYHMGKMIGIPKDPVQNTAC